MKVLYIASGPSMAGGATKSLLAMLRQAGKAGIDYEVVCPSENGIAAHLKESGIRVHVTPFRHACLPLTNGLYNKLKWLPRLIHNAWINFKARSAVTKIARMVKPDIIHENSSAIDVGYHAAKTIGVPDIIHIREYGDLDFKMKLPGRDVRLDDKNVYTISITKDIARHKHQDRNERAVQIYNGIINAEKIRYTSEKKPYILYAGHITEEKGVTDLIKAYIAYAKAQQYPMKLYIAGGCYFPSYLDQLKDLVKKAALTNHVKWLGELKNVDDIMYEATATVIPSKFEALGRVMPEAMANGCLCIGRYTGGTKEQMENGYAFTGAEIAIPYNTQSELTVIFREVSEKTRYKGVFESGGEYFEMIMRSQRAIIEFFSEDQFGKRLMDFYEKIISRTHYCAI